MKRFFSSILFVAMIVTVFSIFGMVGVATPVSAQSMNVCQFIELLISIEAISPDKAVAARTALSCSVALPSYTGLEWAAVDMPGPSNKTWYEGENYCKNLTTTGGRKSGVAWRLPTRQEFIAKFNETKRIPVGFSKYPDVYWVSDKVYSGKDFRVLPFEMSSTVVGDSYGVYGYYDLSGTVAYNSFGKKPDYPGGSVRCVR
jgi:hypothetical protein